MKKIEVFDTLTLRHRKLIMEMLRVHKYRSQRVNHFKMFQAISVPALQAEENFKKDNPALSIRLVYKKIVVIMTPTIYVLANRLVYKMHVTVTKDNKTINSHTGIINNILLRY